MLVKWDREGALRTEENAEHTTTGDDVVTLIPDRRAARGSFVQLKVDGPCAIAHRHATCVNHDTLVGD